MDHCGFTSTTIEDSYVEDCHENHELLPPRSLLLSRSYSSRNICDRHLQLYIKRMFLNLMFQFIFLVQDNVGLQHTKHSLAVIKILYYINKIILCVFKQLLIKFQLLNSVTIYSIVWTTVGRIHGRDHELYAQ